MQKELIERIHSKCIELGLQLYTAESCTAGGIFSTLATIEGSSKYLRAGYIVYNDFDKYRILGISWHILNGPGAVSKQCAYEMSENIVHVRAPVHPTDDNVDNYAVISITGYLRNAGERTGEVYVGIRIPGKDTEVIQLELPKKESYTLNETVHEALKQFASRIGIKIK